MGTIPRSAIKHSWRPLRAVMRCCAFACQRLSFFPRAWPGSSWPRLHILCLDAPLRFMCAFVGTGCIGSICGHRRVIRFLCSWDMCHHPCLSRGMDGDGWSFRPRPFGYRSWRPSSTRLVRSSPATTPSPFPSPTLGPGVAEAVPPLHRGGEPSRSLPPGWPSDLLPGLEPDRPWVCSRIEPDSLRVRSGPSSLSQGQGREEGTRGRCTGADARGPAGPPHALVRTWRNVGEERELEQEVEPPEMQEERMPEKKGRARRERCGGRGKRPKTTNRSRLCRHRVRSAQLGHA